LNQDDVIVPRWPVPPTVRAAFTLRSGGVSMGPFASLNLGTHVGDELDAVEENRRRLRHTLMLPDEPQWLSQVHGTAVATLERPMPGAPLRADAAVTRSPARVCAILVADCLPVLFASRDGAAIGAAHAGWRGLAAGVLEETVRAMRTEVSQLTAWLGPSIGVAHFEVGGEVRDAFVARDAGAAAAFTANPRGRWQCDLPALARRRLMALGVHSIHGEPPCTYADPRRFFSYRRDGQCGRMAALIWMV